MASNTERSRNLIGGMSLLPPSDKLNDGDSLFIQNFRIDQNNKLITRTGSNKRYGPIGSGRFHTIARNAENEYYGIGSELFFHADTAGPIDGGYDGLPLGIAFQGGKSWVMNQGRQRMAIFDKTYKWGVEAPTAAPTAVAVDQVTATIDEFDGPGVDVGIADGETDGKDFKTFAMQDGSPVDNDTAKAEIDGANAQDGSSIKVTISKAANISIYSKSPKSAQISGKSTDSDLIRIWVFCSDPSKVDQVSVFVASGDTGYAEFKFDSGKFLSQSLNSWTQLKLRRRLNLDSAQAAITAAAAQGNSTTVSDLEAQLATGIQTPTFVYTGSGWPQTGIGAPPPSTFPPSDAMLNLDWGGLTKIGVTFITNDACVCGVDKADVVGSSGGENAAGEVTYYVSFFNEWGQDSNPSPASNSIVAGNQPTKVTGLPVSDDEHVTGRYVYRVGGGLSQPLRVATINDNGSDEWDDDTTNHKAQANNIVMPINRDLPPKARGVIGPIYGKLIAFGTADKSSRYFWTEENRGWYFPGADDDAVGNWEDAGSTDDDLIAATDHRPLTVLYKNRSIWVIPGDPNLEDPRQTNSHIGIFGPKAVVKHGSEDFLVGEEGVYSFNMDFEEKLSQPIDPIFKGDYVRLEDNTFLPPISAFGRENIAIECVGDRLYVSYPEHPSTENNVVAVMHLDTRRWTRYTYDNLPAPGLSAMLNEGTGRGFMGAVTSGGGHIYQLESLGFWLDDNLTAKGVWQSKFLDQGLPNFNKIYTDVEIDCATQFGSSPNTTLNVFLLYDNGTRLSLGSITSANTAKPRQTFLLEIPTLTGSGVGLRAKNAAIRIECDIAGIVEIYGIHLHYYTEERVARTFDSGHTDLGAPERVKQVDYTELTTTAAGQSLIRELWSDLPGSGLIVRASDQFATSAGRGNFRQRLGSIVEGRNFRFTLQDTGLNASTFQLHKLRFRARSIGEYIDGTIGEYYECPEFSVQAGRVGELKDFLLDYDVSGDGAFVVVYADMPGGALVPVRTVALPYHSTRAIDVLPFEDPQLMASSTAISNLPFGQLFKVRIYPPAGGILRLHGRAEIRARLIGTYFDGSHGEQFATQPLDLFSGLALFREMEISAAAAGPATLELFTAMAGGSLRQQIAFTFDSSSKPRETYFNTRLPGNTKGHQQMFRVTSAYPVRLYDIRILGRATQIPDSSWTWQQVPFARTGEEWSKIAMPCNHTPEAFSWVEIPVDPIQ